MLTFVTGIFSNRRFQRCSGFSLLELVVVVLLLSLTAALVVPRLPSTRRAELRRSAHQLAALLHYLEERAVATRQVYRLRITIHENKVGIFTRTATGDYLPANDPFLIRQPLADTIRISDLHTEQLGRLTSGEVMINYGPGGRSEAVLFHLSSPDGGQFTVQAAPFSTNIKVAEGYQELIR